MGRRKYKWYIFVLFLFAAIFIVYMLFPKKSGYGIEDMIPVDYDQVDRVWIAGDYDTIEFKLIDSSWYYHDEELNNKAVESLILAATNLRMKSIMPFESVEDFEFIGEFNFYKKRKTMGGFYFLKYKEDYYIHQPGSQQALGVELPGFEGQSLEKIFTSNPEQFMQHLLINLLPSEISSVTIEPLKGDPFRVSADDDYLVENLRIHKDVTSETDSTRVQMLFSYFSEIIYENRLSADEFSRAIADNEPDSRISLETKDGRQYMIEVFEWMKQGEASPDLFTAIIRYNDKDQYYTMNYFYLELLIRGLDAYR